MTNHLSICAAVFANLFVRFAGDFDDNFVKPTNEEVKEMTLKSTSISNIPFNFADLSTEWLINKSYKVKVSTTQKYELILSTHIIPILGKIKLAEISTAFLNQCITELYQSKKEKLSDSSLHSIKYLIKAIISYGVSHEYIPNVHFTFEFAKSIDVSKIQILNQSQEHVILQQTLNKQNPNNLGILISLGTGMRLGEVCSLSIEDINMTLRVISVNKTVQRLSKRIGNKKTELVVSTPKSIHSIREIPIPDFLYEALSSYHRLYNFDSNMYILTNSSKPYDPRTLQYAFERLTKKQGYRNLHFHCLRHTYATRCIEAGIDIKTVSELLGHSDTAFTMNRYVHPSFDTKREAINKLNCNWSRLIT